MIFNDLCKATDEVQATQRILEVAPFNFYLTGSRFFGNTHEGSDWDYFAQFDCEVQAFLLDKGFKRDKASAYGQGSIQGLHTVFKKGLIHVQLVKDVDFKRMIQYNIKKCIDPKALKQKSDARRIWDFYARQVLDVLEAQKQL